MPHRISYGDGEKIVLQDGEIEKISADNFCRPATGGSLVSRDEWRRAGQQAQLDQCGLLNVAVHRLDVKLKVQLSTDGVETELDLLLYPTLLEGEEEYPLSGRISYCKRRRGSYSCMCTNLLQAIPRWIVVN